MAEDGADRTDRAEGEGVGGEELKESQLDQVQGGLLPPVEPGRLRPQPIDRGVESGTVEWPVDR